METAGASKKSLLETFNTPKSKQLNELHNENDFCDLILKCEDGFEIRVHKNVLSSASNYFQQLLTFPMKEKLEESITLPDIPGDILEKIIMFIYTREFEEEIEDVETIIEYAAFFQLEQLVDICSLALSASLNDGTCVNYWQLARYNLIYDFENKCLAYIVSRADHLFESSSMSDLTIEEMRSLLADNRLHLQCDEETIFEYVWKWAKGKVSETKRFSQVFSEVIDLLHFSKLENEFVFQKIFGNEDALANTELLNKVAKLTKPKYKDEVVNRFIFLKPTRRRLLGLGQNKMFICLEEESTIEKDTNHLQHEFGYTTFDNKLLICGGKVDGAITNSCKFFELSTHQWKKFPSMKEARQGHECSYLDNKIYACGGAYNNIVEIFDLSKGEWSYGPKMMSSSHFGLTGVNGALYAIGGRMGVQILDPRTHAWHLGSKFGAKHFRRVRCVSIGPCIYCFTSDKRYIFDTRSNKFSTKEISCKQFSYDWSVCELEGYIYCLEYQNDSVDKYSLNLVQYHLNGNVGLKEFYGLCKPTEDLIKPAIVSLYF